MLHVNCAPLLKYGKRGITYLLSFIKKKFLIFETQLTIIVLYFSGTVNNG